MSPTVDVLFFAAFLVGMVLAVGVIIDLCLIIFWPQIKKRFYHPLKKEEIPWGLRDVGFVFLIYIFVQLLITSSLQLASKFEWLSKQELHYVSLFWATLGVNLVVLLALLAYLSKKHHVHWHQLGFTKAQWGKDIVTGIAGYFGFYPAFSFFVFISAFLCAVLGIEPEMHPIIGIFREETSKTVVILLVLFAALLGPLFEEILFRGMLYPAAKKRFGTKNAIIATAAFFALVHFNSFQFLPIMGLGVLLTLLYEVTGSLIPSIVVHMVNNSVSVALTLWLIYAR